VKLDRIDVAVAVGIGPTSKAAQREIAEDRPIGPRQLPSGLVALRGGHQGNAGIDRGFGGIDDQWLKAGDQLFAARRFSREAGIKYHVDVFGAARLENGDEISACKAASSQAACLLLSIEANQQPIPSVGRRRAVPNEYEPEFGRIESDLYPVAVLGPVAMRQIEFSALETASKPDLSPGWPRHWRRGQCHSEGRWLPRVLSLSNVYVLDDWILGSVSLRRGRLPAFDVRLNLEIHPRDACSTALRLESIIRCNPEHGVCVLVRDRARLLPVALSDVSDSTGRTAAASFR
jgi:hypothetical protein